MSGNQFNQQKRRRGGIGTNQYGIKGAGSTKPTTSRVNAHAGSAAIRPLTSVRVGRRSYPLSIQQGAATVDYRDGKGGGHVVTFAGLSSDREQWVVVPGLTADDSTGAFQWTLDNVDLVQETGTALTSMANQHPAAFETAPGQPDTLLRLLAAGDSEAHQRATARLSAALLAQAA